jgi:hypothetical protein
MVFWELRKIPAETSMAVGNTARWLLPKSGFLSGLLLLGNVTTVSGVTNTTDDNKIEDTLTKIEVIGNGNKEIFSMPGTTVQACSFWDQGSNPISAWREYAENTQLLRSFLSFGRKPYDIHYGLDLSRFDETEFKVTNDMTSTNWSSPAINMYGLFYRGGGAGPPFKGYLKKEMWREWTTVQNETKYLELPSDGILRRILFQSLPDKSSGAATTGFHNLMDNIKYMLQSGQVIVYDDSLNALSVMQHIARGNEVIFSGTYYRVADEQYDCGLGNRLGIGLGVQTQTGSVSTTVPTINDDNYNTFKVEGYAGDDIIGWIARGFAPFGTSIFDHDLVGDGSDWLNLRENKEVELEILSKNASTAASGTNRVILERLV